MSAFLGRFLFVHLVQVVQVAFGTSTFNFLLLFSLPFDEESSSLSRRSSSGVYWPNVAINILIYSNC